MDPHPSARRVTGPGPVCPVWCVRFHADLFLGVDLPARPDRAGVDEVLKVVQPVADRAAEPNEGWPSALGTPAR